MTTCVFFDTNALYIEGYRDSFAAGTLAYDVAGGAVGVRVLHGSEYLVQDDWSGYARQDGTGFASLAELTAYLDGQFAMRRPVGSPQRSYALAAADFQTVFPLSPAPTDVNTVLLLVNGTSFGPPDIAVSELAVTWQGAFDLAASDTLRVTYF